MFGRYFLIFLSIVSLIWLGYATYDRVNQSKIFNPEYLFGKEDGELLILINPKQQNTVSSVFEVENTEIQSLIPNLNADFIDRIYISKKRGQLLITTKEAIDKKLINNIFVNSSSVKTDKKSISYGSLKGQFSKHSIYLSSQSYNQNKNPWIDLKYDKNSDASIISFGQKTPSVTDVYIKENGVVEYKTSFKNAVLGEKVNDKVVFASIVPSSIQSYQFYETDYLRFSQPEILNSPMNNWLKYGLVRILINNQEVIITDFIDGQEPIQVLYDFYQKESKDVEHDYFENVSFGKLLNNSKGVFIYQVDDFVVISSSQSACETVIGGYKLGNTLSQNPDQLNKIFHNLPQKVNYRKVESDEKVSISVYENTLLTTNVGGAQQSVNNSIKENQQVVQSYVVGSSIKDIVPIDENSFFVTTQDNKVLFFDKEGKKWEQTLEENLVGEASIIDVYANEKSQLLVATGKKINVIDINGNQPNGFPIELDEHTNILAPLFYRWKGNGFFIASTANGRLVQYDNQGRELTIIKTQLNSIDLTPVVWVSANKPFIGVSGNDRFEMIQVENKKSFRTFDAKNINSIIKLPNEVKLFGINNNQLISYDQRGGLSRFDQLVNAKLIPTILPEKGIVVKDQNHIKLFNSSGLQWGVIKLPFNDVTDVQLFSLNNGNTIVTGIDGLENKVYIWKTNGELQSKTQFDGSKLVRYYNGYIFTVVDNLVVRYPLGN